MAIQLRRDTAANFTTNNPTLAAGQPGYETNTEKLKIGDGSTAWTALAYFGGSGSVATDPIFDAKGDLPVGTGADTAVRLVVGANGRVLQANSATATGLEWVALAGGGDALVANPLSQFAATTSLQLKDTITNETGSGALVFGTSPALVTPTGIVKADVGLGSVDNTSDAAKPVSTAQQTALNLKANLAGPTFTGTVTIPSTAAITDAANKRFITDAQQTVITNTSGTNTGDQSLAGLQPIDATLTALAALTIAADSLSIGTGGDAFTQTTFAANTFPAKSSAGALVAKTITDFGLSQIDDANAAAGRTTLELGSIATQTATALSGAFIYNGFSLNDSADNNTLSIRPAEDLTANRILNIVVGNVTRTLTFTADATIGGTSSGTNTGDKPLEILDEGLSVITNPANLDFVGAGVTVTTFLGNTTITIPGGSGSGLTHPQVMARAAFAGAF